MKHVRKSATRRLYDNAPPGSINFGLGELDIRTPDVIRSAAIQAIHEAPLGYTQNAGLPELREQVARYHSRALPAALGPESVCITNGTEEALFCAMMAFAGPGDEVMLPDPGFLAYPTLVELTGATAVTYRLPASRAFAFDRESFDQAISDRTKLMVLNSPSNPTGRVIPDDDLRFIAERLTGTEVCIIADEIYRDLYFEREPSSIAEYYDRTIIVSGLSKMMSMTGWRLGWAAGPPDLINCLTVMHQYVSTCATSVSQRAALAAFTDEGRRATAEIRAELRRRRDVMVGEIERSIGRNYVVGEGAFYVMLDVSPLGPSETVAEGLLRERLITVPGSAFGSEAEGFLRLSFSIEPELIREGVARLARGLESAADT